MLIKKKKNWGCPRQGSVSKSTSCVCRGPRFTSQHPHGGPRFSSQTPTWWFRTNSRVL